MLKSKTWKKNKLNLKNQCIINGMIDDDHELCIQSWYSFFWVT